MAEDQVSTTTSGTGGQAPPMPAGQAPTPASPTAPTGQAPAVAAGRPDDSTLPDDIRTYIESLRAENASHRQAKKAAETAAAEAATSAKRAEETALAEQQKWQELAQRREQDIAALRPQAELANQLTAWVGEYINRVISGWPEEVKGMAPNGETTPLAMLEWLEKARPLAERLTQPAPAPGSGARPRPAGIGQAQAAQAREQSLMTVRSQF